MCRRPLIENSILIDLQTPAVCSFVPLNTKFYCRFCIKKRINHNNKFGAKIRSFFDI